MVKKGITHSVKPFNEDAYGLTDHGAFVLDGASGLDSEDQAAVVAMVGWWQAYLMTHLDELDRSLQDILLKGIEEFNTLANPGKKSKLEQVSSAIGIVRRREAGLECFVLGDVEISIKYRSGEVKILTDRRIKDFDQEVIDVMQSDPDREEACVFKGFTRQEWELLKINRLKMNTEEGYYILSHDPQAVQRGVYALEARDEIDCCVIFSDGFSPLDQVYPRGDLMARMNQSGLKAVLEELRTHEKEDFYKRKMKRLKTHDDATAVLWRFSTSEGA